MSEADDWREVVHEADERVRQAIASRHPELLELASTAEAPVKRVTCPAGHALLNVTMAVLPGPDGEPAFICCRPDGEPLPWSHLRTVSQGSMDTGQGAEGWPGLHGRIRLTCTKKGCRFDAHVRTSSLWQRYVVAVELDRSEFLPPT